MSQIYYFCDNPKCLMHVLVPITVHKYFLNSGAEYQNHLFIRTGKKDVHFCDICKQSYDLIKSYLKEPSDG